jgi:alkylhydroperoxidase family enzyme
LSLLKDSFFPLYFGHWSRGLTDEIKQAIPHFRESPLFTAAEKAAIQLADAMASDHKTARYDEIFSELKKYYTEE